MFARYTVEKSTCHNISFQEILQVLIDARIDLFLTMDY